MQTCGRVELLWLLNVVGLSDSTWVCSYKKTEFVVFCIGKWGWAEVFQYQIWKDLKEIIVLLSVTQWLNLRGETNFLNLINENIDCSCQLQRLPRRVQGSLLQLCTGTWIPVHYCIFSQSFSYTAGDSFQFLRVIRGKNSVQPEPYLWQQLVTTKCDGE